MAGFVYYLPGASLPLGSEDIANAGLAYAFAGEKAPLKITTTAGPEGQGPGIVLAAHDYVAAKAGYKDGQTWRRVPKTDAWVGMYPDDRPGPDDLAAKQQVPGHYITLGDGNDWLIPVARAVAPQDGRLVGYCALPHTIDCDDDGNWTAETVVVKYAPLWNIAERFLDSVLNSQEDGEDIFNFQGMTDAALIALATNYRLGRAEVGLLGIFDVYNTLQLLGAVIDSPTSTEWIKKKAEQGTTASSAGPADSPPDTTPQ
jgi:hypothetical protein